jgi:hypothetical protein
VNEEDVTGFLSRWSRRKLEKAEPAAAPQPAEAPASPPASGSANEAPPPEPLPPVESLTPDSDFKPFMRPDVEPGVKQAALKQLFKDPQFNVMDGLDTYIDDYGIPDPIPASMMKTLYQARQHLFSDEEKAAADKADAEAAAAIDAAAPATEPFPTEPPHPYAPDQKA